MFQKQSYENYQIPANTIMLAANKTLETKQNKMKQKQTNNLDQPRLTITKLKVKWETYINYSICLNKRCGREIGVNVIKLTVITVFV